MTDDGLDKPIGTKETEKLSAKTVIIDSVSIAPPKEGSKAKLVTFSCRHPDREELIKLSAIKIMKITGNTETTKKETLWYNTDVDGNISKGSAIAILMNYYKKKTLREFEKSSVETALDTQGYLSIKAY